ncbi:MAG TPA: response regulator [Myxococcales bacterium]|nr:response regulator [Myxococcales bacterium]
MLIVEDNPGDVDLIMDVMRDAPVKCRVATDGIEALLAMREHKPDLVLLDLNLPKKDGREVLAEIKADAQLQHIPVVVLSSSEAERDLAEVYRLHGNCFLTKPVDLDDFQRVVGSVEQFWLRTAKLPPSAAA